MITDISGPAHVLPDIIVRGDVWLHLSTLWGLDGKQIFLEILGRVLR